MSKRKEARIDRCEKCDTVTYVHKHHILKKSVFGEGETIDLCPNCHTKYHEFLYKQDIDQKDMEANLFAWFKWFHAMILILGIIISLLISIN